MYFSTFLNVQEVFLSGPLSIEHLWIKVKPMNHDYLLLGCVYRSPSSYKLFSMIDLCNLLQTIVGSKPSHLLIVGDFNTVKSIGTVAQLVEMIRMLLYFWTQSWTASYFSMP